MLLDEGHQIGCSTTWHHCKRNSSANNWCGATEEPTILKKCCGHYYKIRNLIQFQIPAKRITKCVNSCKMPQPSLQNASVFPAGFSHNNLHSSSEVFVTGVRGLLEIFPPRQHLNLTPMSDQDRISPYNINTISSGRVMRIIITIKISVKGL